MLSVKLRLLQQFFLPVLFEASDRICAAGGDPSPKCAAYFGHRLLRQPEGVSGEHLAYSCRSCFEGMASAWDSQCLKVGPN